MSGDMLFPMPDPPSRAKPVEKISEDRQRTERQREAIRLGYHPLATVVGYSLRLHPSANRDATKDDPKGEPFTCGSCVHRILQHHHDYTYPKCDRVITSSAATDCRAWWPGCVFWEPRSEPSSEV